MLDIIVIIIFGRLALVRHTFNRCELLCNFIYYVIVMYYVANFK